MPLYQTSVLKKYLKQQDTAAIAKAYKAFAAYFLDPKIQENIRQSKEEEYQGPFLTALFAKVLGYTMKPHDGFNLVAEYKNEKNSKKADGAIIKDDQAICVIELKGTETKDLEKARQQAFDYKANQTGCIYVITSNFEKLRFYINNAVEYEEFDLFALTADRFALLGSASPKTTCSTIFRCASRRRLYRKKKPSPSSFTPTIRSLSASYSAIW